MILGPRSGEEVPVMFVLNDDRCNAYVREGGKIVCRRAGESAVFESLEEAEKARAQFLAENRCLSPVWVEEL